MGRYGEGPGRVLTSARVIYLVTGAGLIVACGLALLVLPTNQVAYLLPGILLVLVLGPVTLKIWERPILGIVGAVALIAVPLSTGGEGQALTHVTLPDLMAAFVVGVVALRTLLLGDQGRLRSWVVLPLAGILVAGGAATFTAAEPVVSISGLVRYAEIFVVIPAATYLAVRNRADLVLILGTVVALGVFEGAVGVYQYLTSAGAAYGESEVRAVGTFGAYDIMAMATVVSYALLVVVSAFAGLRDNRRLLALLLAGTLVVPLAFSYSRGSWIAAAVGMLAILAVADRKSLVLLILAGGLILGGASASVGADAGPLGERLASITSATTSPDQSVKDRYAMWQAARQMWAGHPFTGVGMKNFPYYRDLYAPLSFSGGSDIEDPSGGFRRVELLTPHNLYLLILAEQGLLGALAYGILFLSLGVAGVRNVLGSIGSAADGGFMIQRVFGLSCLGFLAAYLTGGIYGDVGGSMMVMESMFLGGLLWLASGASLEESD